MSEGLEQYFLRFLTFKIGCSVSFIIIYLQRQVMSIKLNCDMGESFGIYKLGLDKQIMPYIDMANLACGFHAGDPVTMHRSIRNAVSHCVEIGAHPSYPDLVGFGRREMSCSSEEIVSFVLYQLGALEALCRSYGTIV